MAESLRVRICRYIDIQHVDNFYDFKYFCSSFMPHWYSAIKLDEDFYFHHDIIPFRLRILRLI